MPIITKLSPQRNKKYVNVHVDGKFAFGIDLDNLYKFGLKVEREYTQEELDEINKEVNFSKTFNKLLNYAMLRPRSEKELRDWLWRKKIGEDLHDKLLQKLSKFDVLDDEKFAQWWIRQRVEFKHKSKKEIYYELRQKGIDSKIIKKAISNADINELAAAKKLAEKKSRLETEKLKAYLLRKGFGWDIVKKVLE